MNNEVKVFFDEARANRPAARELLAMFTRSCRSLEEFERERQTLINAGISPDFLPDALSISSRRQDERALLTPDHPHPGP
ncbi:hypothetical protein [Nonomuraea helvata]|uniref:Uncharacterized protein n=1 Tax=Nonomuraea helvata TaxID=37484 RepID=A0ABV5SA25_9ACTN